MSIQPKASIVIPTYNERENIVALIEALRAEIRQPLEIIVVDDARRVQFSSIPGGP